MGELIWIQGGGELATLPENTPNPAAVYLASLGEGSRRAMGAQLQTGYAPATANKALSALRRVLQECWRLGLMSVEDYQRAVDLANIQGETLPAGRDIDAGEIAALMGDCTRGERNLDYRDAAVLACLLVGHASPQTTARYDRRPKRAKREAVARLHIPYRRG